jgi:hypothetical protein
MTQTITRLFDTHEDAASAVRDLEAAGVRHDSISLISNNTDGRHRADNDAGEGAAKGAATGGVIGGGAGLLAGLGMLAIPGLGPVVAAGWLASTAVGAAVGAVAGGATGGLLGALKDAGHSDEEANVYAEGVRRGGSLVSVKSDRPEEIATAQTILTSRGVGAAERGAVYRSSGWSRFDETAPPYSTTEIAAERSRYAESRSFQDQADRDLGATDEDLGGAAIRPEDPTLRNP